MLSGLVPILIPVALAGVPVQAATVTGAECASYLYRGTSVSLCDRFAGRGDVDCPEIKHPVTVTGLDHWRLDRDGDKSACEEQTGYTPAPPSKSPSASASPSPSRPSARPSTSPSRAATSAPSTSPAPSRSTSATPAAGPQLPVTGPALPALLIVGGGAFAVGVGGLSLLAARRRNRFEA